MILRKINAETGVFICDVLEVDLLEDGSIDPLYSYVEEFIPDTIYAKSDVSPKWTGSEWVATAERPVPTPNPPSDIEKLEAKITAATEYTDFLEEVIVEMAQVVFN